MRKEIIELLADLANQCYAQSILIEKYKKDLPEELNVEIIKEALFTERKKYAKLVRDVKE